MSYRFRNHSLLLAALLQVLPIVRMVCTQPSFVSTCAIIFRWTIGGTAALGAFDSVSGATSVFTTPSTFNGSVGTYFSNNIIVSIGGGNTASSSDYFLVNAGNVISPTLNNGKSTTVAMPPGLTFLSSWVNGSKNLSAVVYGTPTQPGTFPITVTGGSPGNAALSQAITITITGTVTPTAPGISSQPVGTNVIAGKNAVFTVTAGGTAPLTYVWSKNNNALTDGGNISGSHTATLTVANVSSGDAGNYSVAVANSVSSVTSSNAALSVILPPAITAQPQGQTAAAGGTAGFSVTATGTGSLGYFWLKNGVALANGTKYSGVNSSALGISAITTADAGNFSVIVSNLAGSITSSNAALAIVTSPAISTQPLNRSVAVGASVSFTVAAAGSSPMYFIWQKNGSPLADGGNVSGATTAALNLASVTTNDAAAYSVIVSNSLGSVTSSNASLAVLVPASIVNPPAGVTALAGSNVTFTVTAGGSTPLTFVWRKNGNPIANGGNISGATTPTLTLANVTVNDAGNYSAAVSNAAGGDVSSAATLSVLVPPTITAQPQSATVSSGANASLGVTVAGTAPLSLQWFKNGIALADGANVLGSSSNILTLIGVTTNDTANYYVTIANSAGSTNSFAATLSVIVRPSIITPPASVTTVATSNATFDVVVDGTAPFTYQWRKNSVNLPGANAATLSLTNVTLASAGSYSVAVGNSAGSVTSTVATLTILSPPVIVTQPTDQVSAPGNSVSLSVTAYGTETLSYQWFKGGAALTDGTAFSGANSNVLTIATLTTNEVDVYYVTISNSLGSVTSSSASISVNVSPIISVQPVSQITARSNIVIFSVIATGTGPLVYQWRKDGSNLAGATASTLTLTDVTANQNGIYSVRVTNIFGSTTSSNASLAVYIPPRISASPTNCTAIMGTNVAFAATVKGTVPLVYRWLKNEIPLFDGGNISGAASNVLTIASITPDDAAIYSLAVSNIVGYATSAGANLTVLVPPSIVLQPSNQTVTLGKPVIFSVSADGTAPLRYQWTKAGIAIPGATNASLVLGSVTTNDAVGYKVVVTNIAGSVTSAKAKLTVWISPAITLQPTNRTVKVATTTIFNAAVSGTTPMVYQWSKDGVALVDTINITGSTSNILTIANVTTNDAGAYFLTASNLAGSAKSTNALLKILSPPTVVKQIGNYSAILSNSITMNIAVNGTAPMYYQWRKAGVTIAGATNATYTITRVRLSDAGVYSVLASNIAGSVISSNGVLTVLTPPLFTLQASNRTARLGSTTVFRAAVQGSAPFTFQWLKDGVPVKDSGTISGSQSNILTVAGLTQGSTGAYTLSVSNFAGAITSSNAVLRVGRSGGDDGDNRPATIALAKAASILTPSPLTIGQISLNGNGSVTLHCSGVPNTDYVLQATTDFAKWTAIATNTADSSGVWQVTDGMGLPVKFYRIQSAR